MQPPLLKAMAYFPLNMTSALQPVNQGDVAPTKVMSLHTKADLFMAVQMLAATWMSTR